MKKLSKADILKLELESFNIRPLTLWVRRVEKRLVSGLKEIAAQEGLTEAVHEAQQTIMLEDFKDGVPYSHPTVGQLIARYKYSFPGPKGRLVSLGTGPCQELKNKLMQLGLTPDDWPALVDRDQLLVKLSRDSILDIPIRKIIPTTRNQMCDGLKYYLNCEDNEVRKKTVRDFIAINPLDFPHEGLYEELRAGRYFRRHERLLTAIRQKLAQKGFTSTDGAFMKWDPDRNSLRKACAIFRKYRLTPSQVRRFAKIAVAERWVS